MEDPHRKNCSIFWNFLFSLRLSPVSGRIKVNYFAHTRLTLEAKSREVNNINARRRCEICSKLTIKTPEQRH